MTGATTRTAQTDLQPLRPSLPTLSVRRQGEPLATVGSKGGECRLLHTRAHSELTEVQLQKDARLTLMPAGAGVETFYLLSGRLGGQLAGEPCVVEQGDTLATENLAGPLVLTALEGTRLLYLTDGPQFHLSRYPGQLERLAAEGDERRGDS